MQRWVAHEVGPVIWGARLDTPFGEARVQRATAQVSGLRWILKQHRAPAGHRAEATALVSLAAHLGTSVPHLAARSDDPRALLLRELPGDQADARRHDDESGRIHEAAGRFVARLQTVPIAAVDPMPADEAIARRLAGWLRRSTLPGALRDLAEGLVRPDSFAGARRVWAHRDYRPANWLWHAGELAVLDFGHARADVAAADLTKLAAGAWRHSPALRDAFLRGYGGTWGDQQEAQLRSLCALHGLATASWGQTHGDEAARREGEQVLAWCAERAR